MTRLRPFGLPEIPASTGSEASAFDRWAIESLGIPQRLLMENAGRAAADVVSQLAPTGPVLALAGGGNNGGDAWVAARTLASLGRDVSVVRISDVAGSTESETQLCHGWQLRTVDAAKLDDDAWRALFNRSSVVVDGILGTGIRGAPRGAHAGAIDRVNEFGTFTVSLDIPSGVDSDSGRVEGEAVRADVTVAFGQPKIGSLLHPGRRYAGRLVAVEIGFPPHPAAEFAARLITPGWVEGRLPDRALDTHKNQVGALLLVAGRSGMAGAAVLAARAALRGGAGLVRVATSQANREVMQAAVPEAVFVDVSSDTEIAHAVEASRAVAIGPGLGTDDGAESALRHVLDQLGSHSLVVDADGLNLLSEGRPVEVTGLPGDREVLLTPHPGEMARLTRSSVQEVQADRVGAARSLADRSGCTVLLKGAPSLVARKSEPVLISTTGSSALATGGMGDVLTGLSGALLAQGLSSVHAAGVALHLSGRAAMLRESGAGLLPSDVVDNLPAAASERGFGETDLVLRALLFDQDAPE